MLCLSLFHHTNIKVMQCHHLSHTITIGNICRLIAPSLFVCLFCVGGCVSFGSFVLFCGLFVCSCVMAVDGTCWTSTVLLLMLPFATSSHQEVRVYAVIRGFV